MKSTRLALLGFAAALLTPLSLVHAGDGYANGTSGTDTWNDAAASLKWTSDAGVTFVAPTAGNVYHTNGNNVKAGQIGVPSDLGAAGATTFAGDQLIVDGYSAASGGTSNATAGKLIFEQGNTANNVQASGPRQTPSSYYRAEYTANIVTAPTTGADVRTLQGSTGLITLKGTLTLNGTTNFFLPSKVSDMRFNIEAALSGSGDIVINGGSAGGTTTNGFVTWAFGDMSQWHGTAITVANKHTIAFTQNTDFYTTNPTLQLDFSNTSAGFINLSANVSVGSGKVKIATGTSKNPATFTLLDGIYTVYDLNALAIAQSASGAPYSAQTWASEGAGYDAAGTTYKLYVGQALPATAPTISTQPASKAVFAGSSVTFSVVATGTPAPTYQWQKDGSPLAGKTDASLSLTNVSSAEAGDYAVVVTNVGGTVTSNVATLTVQTVAVAPSFTAQPQSKTSYAGTTVTFTATATGTPAPTYTWQLNGTAIAGATTATLTRSSISDASAGTYTCVATNSAGFATSTGAVLTVTPLPTGVQAYANANATGSSDNWNAAKDAVQWTFDAGTTYLAASTGNTYHTNGYTIRAGHAATVAPLAPGVSTFNGATLVVDAFSSASQLTDNSAAGGGTLNFEPASTGAGPRLSPTSTTRAAFTANIVTTATPLVDQPRNIRTNTGSATLDGTLVLNGKTVFSIPGSVTDVLFDINSPVTGAGSIELSGGSSGAGTANGFVTWAFHNLNGWTGASLAVMHHHTVSFAGPTDLYRTNPAGAVVLGSTSSPSSGYLNIQADVSFGSGKLSIITGSATTPVTTVIPDNTYTVASLNAYVANVVAGTSGGYVDLPLASEGPTNTTTPNYSGTTYRIYVGSGLPNQAPTISTQPQGATVLLGETVTLTVAADGSPAPTFQWQKDNVAIAGATAATLTIASAQVTDSGTYTVVATNAVSSVTSSGALVTVNLPPAPPFTAQPASLTQNAGTTATFTAAVAPSAFAPTYQWQKDGSDVAGATSATLTIANIQAAHAGSYTVIATNAGGSTTSTAATLVVTPAAPTVEPAAPLTVGAGSPITLTAVAHGTEPFTYTWAKDGVIIAGATDATYTIANAQASDSGIYTYTATNSVGTAMSADAQVVVNAVSSTYLSNVSVRVTTTPTQTLIMGFVVANGSKPILVRAAGPMLNTFGLTGAPNPSVTLFDSSTNPATSVAVNDDWSLSLKNKIAELGAYPFADGSKDAALLQTITGPHTANAMGGGSGALLAEAYDAGTNNGPKLVNVSARFNAGTGNDVLIAGLVIAGTGQQWVLIRAIGPTLADFGVPGTLVDPKVEVHHTVNQADVIVASNDNWDAALATEFSRLGAFPLTANSKDAALLVLLDAGAYTVQVSGVNGGTGEALVEVYDATP
ncbi:immunoglobulin domain-containing protein [Horticoccus luteus]|uniref:Immunoglobulin domain-containing protein n=1 Tax=Horticoccus luteus TaxID=2862869 RepID=A0A8F9TV53_9BACT|nr:immunoglobulin domain-containing protein [Horticoccus luteus]QYM78561.1 immunoglobulin domain-containing protein [Horticoccus luteus]